MTDEELNKNLATKCGFRDSGKVYGISPLDKHLKPVWIHPDGEEFVGTFPSFTITPAACLKYIMPVLKEQGLHAVMFFWHNGQAYCALNPLTPDRIERLAETETLAFCRAAWEFLKDKQIHVC
jgi:hypothetical protein